MLTHPTLDQLNAMGLHGMAKAFNDLAANPETDGLGHADWLALLLDRESVHRQDKRLGARLRYARLRHQAAPEDIDYRASRGLDRRLMQDLIGGGWIDAHDNLVITGPTGVGKSWLAGLCPRPQGLPRQPLRPLRPRPQALRRAGPGPRRRQLRAPAQEPRRRRAAHLRRLGS